MKHSAEVKTESFTEDFSNSQKTNVRILQLFVKNFRNHSELSLSVPSNAPIVLTGSNGAGKTSLLEAISLLGPSRGLRQAGLDGLAKKGTTLSAKGEAWGITAKIIKDEKTQDKINLICKTEQASSGGKESNKIQVKINNRPASAIELTKHLNLFWLTPAMARFYSEGSQRAEVRKFIDRIVMGLEPFHAQNLANFDRTRRQRQKVLENASIDDAWLEVLEGQMADCGVAIGVSRSMVIEKLNQKMDIHKPENFPSAILEASGNFENEFLQLDSLQNVENYKKALAKMRNRDKISNRTNLGPHQAEISLFNKTQNLPVQSCSTGEVKALLTGLVLSAASLAALEKKISPIILLDEIVAHLDETRRLALFDKIAEWPAQIWMSGTDPKSFAPLKMDAHFFDIKPNCAHPS